LGQDSSEEFNMAFSESERKEIDDLLRPICNRVPEHLHHKLQIEYTISGHTVTLNEKRPHFRNPQEWVSHGIARFRFSRPNAKWQLYWQRASLKWEAYGDPSPDLASLVAEVEKDPLHCFWG
jgi:hypothetical protein